MLLQKRARELQVAASHAVGDRIDGMLSSHHRRRLRKLGWEHALDAAGFDYSTKAGPRPPETASNLLVDGAAMLPAVAEALESAQSHVHLAGWFFSPEFDLTRGEDPLILRNLLADLAERVDVRVLGWSGAPLPLFHPSRGDVRSDDRPDDAGYLDPVRGGLLRPADALPSRKGDRGRRPGRIRGRHRPHR